MQVNLREQHSPIKGLSRTFTLLSGTYFRGLSLLALLSLIGIIFMGLLDTGISWFFFELLGWVINFEQDVMDDISVIALTFINIYFVHLIFIMLVTGFAMDYYSLLEIKEAPSLKQQIKQIGRRQTIKGLEKE